MQLLTLFCIAPVGFSEKVLRIVEKEDGVAPITIFTNIMSINGSMATFKTLGGNATEGKKIVVCDLVHYVVYSH